MLLRLAAMLIALPAIALAAGALAADAPDAGGGATVIGAPAKTAAAETGAADASTAAPAVTPLPPPPAPVDGSECRMGCAQAYYFCRVNDQTGDCAPTWSQCVAACDLPNLDTGVSTAP